MKLYVEFSKIIPGLFESRNKSEDGLNGVPVVERRNYGSLTKLIKDVEAFASEQKNYQIDWSVKIIGSRK